MMLFQGTLNRPNTVQLSDVAEAIKQGNVERITVSNDDIDVVYKNGLPEASSKKEAGATIGEQLKDFGVTSDQLAKVAINIDNPLQLGRHPGDGQPCSSPPVIILLIFLFMFRQAQGANSQAMSFGRSRARMFVGDRPHRHLPGRRRRGGGQTGTV